MRERGKTAMNRSRIVDARASLAVPATGVAIQRSPTRSLPQAAMEAEVRKKSAWLIAALTAFGS